MNTKKTFQKLNFEKGTILFIVLIFIVAITIIVLIRHFRSVTEINFLGDEFEKLKAYFSCYSGAQFAFNRILTSTKNRIEFLDVFHNQYNPRLMLDGSEILISVFDMVDENFYNSLPEPIFGQIENQKLKLHFQDSAGLINFFRIRRDLLLNFFVNNQIIKEQAQIIIDSLMDWMDADDFARYNGAERDFYITNKSVIPPNRLIDTPEELLLIRGITRDVFNKIENEIDFTVQNRGLNPNTMPGNIFRLLFELQDEKIDEIMRLRKRREFENLAALTQRSNHNFSLFPNTFQFFTSDSVYVTISANMSEGREFFLKVKLYQSGRRKSLNENSFKGGFRSTSDVSGKWILDEILQIQNWLEGTKK